MNTYIPLTQIQTINILSYLNFLPLTLFSFICNFFLNHLKVKLQTLCLFTESSDYCFPVPALGRSLPVCLVIFDCEVIVSRGQEGQAHSSRAQERLFFLLCVAPADQPLPYPHFLFFSSLSLWHLGISSSFFHSPVVLGICSSRVFWFSTLSYYRNWKFPWFSFSELRLGTSKNV